MGNPKILIKIWNRRCITTIPSSALGGVEDAKVGTDERTNGHTLITIYHPLESGGVTATYMLPLLMKVPNPNDYNIEVSSGRNETIWILKDSNQRKLLRRRQVMKRKYLQKAVCNQAKQYFRNHQDRFRVNGRKIC